MPDQHDVVPSSRPCRPATRPGLRIGVDLGGSKIEIVALDAAGNERVRRRVTTPQGDYRAIVGVIAHLVESVEFELGERGQVGLGIPGAEAVSNALIKNANSTCLIGRPLRRDLQTLLQRPIRIANDANCFALSEAIGGAGDEAAVVFGVILGTGVGGGIVVHKQLITGINRIAGEWGHNPLPNLAEESQTPPDCYCGRQGCVETWLSGPALAADHVRHGGEALSAEEIARRGENDDAACLTTLSRYERRLAKALASVINVLDPDVIVLGGGLSRIGRLYTSVPALWGQFIFSDSVRTVLRPPQHGDASGVRGAAWLWNE